jgi:hypothetical protein
MKCTNCGTDNAEGLRFCGNCGTPLALPSIPPNQPTPPTSTVEETASKISTIEQRRAILDWAISQRIRLGYRLAARSDTTAQLVKPKSFNAVFAVICVLLIVLFGVGLVLLIIYFIAYLAQKEKSVYLEVDQYGRLKVTDR